jgi:hypothetical protein
MGDPARESGTAKTEDRKWKVESRGITRQLRVWPAPERPENPGGGAVILNDGIATR